MCEPHLLPLILLTFYLLPFTPYLLPLTSLKRPVNLGDLILKELCGRMDPATRLVTPNWRTVASDLGVSLVTIGKYIRRLKADGIVTTVVVEAPAERNPSRQMQTHPDPTWLPNASKRYFINENVNADWATSVEPQFTRPALPAKDAKRRYKTTKAELDAAADARMAERARLVMEDFLSRMDSETHTVSPQTKDIVKRIGRGLTLPSYIRVVRAFKAAGLIKAERIHDSSGDHSSDYVFKIDSAAASALDYLAFAKEYRLKTAHAISAPGKGMTAREILADRIFDHLRERMDPVTHFVKANQLELGKELGFSQSSIHNALKTLIAANRIVKVTGPARRGLGADARVYRLALPQSRKASASKHQPPPTKWPSSVLAAESRIAYADHPEMVAI